jgi:hypothetical protein
MRWTNESDCCVMNEYQFTILVLVLVPWIEQGAEIAIGPYCTFYPPPADPLSEHRGPVAWPSEGLQCTALDPGPGPSTPLRPPLHSRCDKLLCVNSLTHHAAHKSSTAELAIGFAL